MGATWRTGLSQRSGTSVSRPAELIAHRGTNREALENSIAAFSRALELEVDGIELDIQLTRDGIPVVQHDPSLPTSSAGGGRERIATLTLSEVRARVDLPTLDDVIDLVGARCYLYVEIKDPVAVEAVVKRLTARHEWCAIHSFDHRVAARVNQLDSRLPTGILLVSRLVDTTSALRVSHARDLWQQVEFIDRALVDEVHAAGARVIAWTVNDVAACRRLVELGVDGVCTDGPREMLSELNRAAQS